MVRGSLTLSHGMAQTAIAIICHKKHFISGHVIFLIQSDVLAVLKSFNVREKEEKNIKASKRQSTNTVASIEQA